MHVLHKMIVNHIGIKKPQNVLSDKASHKWSQLVCLNELGLCSLFFGQHLITTCYMFVVSTATKITFICVILSLW